MIWMRGRSNIRRLRIVLLSIVIGNGIITVLVDDHLPGDLRLGLLTIPMIRGPYLKRDCFLNIHPSGIGTIPATVPAAVPLPIPSHAPSLKAAIVAGAAAAAQVETIQASTAGPVNLVANGNDQPHVKNVNDENIKKRRERKTGRRVGKRRKGTKKDGAS